MFLFEWPCWWKLTWFKRSDIFGHFHKIDNVMLRRREWMYYICRCVKRLKFYVKFWWQILMSNSKIQVGKTAAHHVFTENQTRFPNLLCYITKQIILTEKTQLASIWFFQWFLICFMFFRENLKIHKNLSYDCENKYVINKVFI